jgi:YegS/Rv2252/BmrU family lipid kinase
MKNTDRSPYLVIINPNAGKRRGERDWPVISGLLKNSGISFTHLFTLKRFDALDFAKQGVEKGIRNIIVVGGDGTLNEAVNGIFSQSVVPPNEVTMAMIPIGTGNDWGKMYRLPKYYSSVVQMITERHTFLQDVGIAVFHEDGSRKERHFINIAGIGYDAFVTFDTNRKKEMGGGGKIAYMLSLLGSLMKYSHQNISVMADGQFLFTGELYSANIGICKFNGGGMMQVPYAISDDGLFDITIFRRMNKLTVIRNVKRLFDGSFVRMKQVSTHRAASVSISSNEKVLLEVDGESIGTVPVEFRILHKALKVVVPVSYFVK